MAKSMGVPCGAFELLEPIGEGGMGQVWRGVHRRQSVPVAVKVMGEGSVEGTKGMSLFRREVQAQAALDHPGIARVFDYGRLPEEVATGSDGLLQPETPYLVMSLADAGTLADAPELNSWEECCAVVLCLLDALAHAHARRVIHRDIKPENILWFPDHRPEGRWKLCDFGLAHAIQQVRDRSTKDMLLAAAGTPFYMPPEQLRGEWRHYGPWTDLYQVGCLFFELLCGRPPFVSGSVLGVATKHVTDPIPELEPRFAVPPGAQKFVEHLMAKDAAQRYRRAADAARDLMRLSSQMIPRDVGGTNEARDSEKGSTSLASLPTRSLIGLAETLPDTKLTPEEWSADKELEPLASETVAGPRGSGRKVAETWRFAREETTGRPLAEIAEETRLVDVGLGLFGLRQIPFVGRETERDRIWEELCVVTDEKRPRFLCVEGRSGTGKSRLARWISQRAHELGVATTLRLVHDSRGGTADGIDGMLADWSRTGGLNRRDAFGVILRRLAAYPKHGDRKGGEDRELAAGLTEILHPSSEESRSDDGPAYRIESVEHKYSLVLQLISRLARRRTVLVWFDDLQRSPESLAFIEFLFEQPSTPAVILLGTVQTDDPGLTPVMQNRLNAVWERYDAEVIRLDPLGVSSQAELIDRLLPLTPDLTTELSNRTEGHPLFAVQLVGDWVDRELLEPSEEGFQLAESVEPMIPDDLQQLWARRIDPIVDGLCDREHTDGWPALELAAVFGRQIEDHQWLVSCKKSGFEVSVGTLKGELIERGLAEYTANGFRFVHGLLVECLRQRAKESRRLVGHHRVCAETLEELCDGERGSVDIRCAEHYVAAGMPERALKPLGDACRYFGSHRGDRQREKRLLDRRSELIEICGLTSDDRRRAEQDYLLADNAGNRGDFEMAECLGLRVEEAARIHDWPKLLSKVLQGLSYIAFSQGDLDEMSRRLDDALAAAQRVDDECEIAHCWELQAVLAQSRGRLQKASNLLERARKLYQNNGDVLQDRRCLLRQGFVEKNRGNFDAAREIVVTLRELADKHGDPHLEASALNLEGEVARLTGQWQRARKSYEEGNEIHGRLGTVDTVYVELNLALVDAGAGKWKEAGIRFQKLDDILAGHGVQRGMICVHLGMMGYSASRKDWEKFEKRREMLELSLARTNHGELDAFWLAGHVARACVEAGDKERADRVEAFVTRLRDLDCQ